MIDSIMPNKPFPELKASPSLRHCSNCKNIMSLYTLPRHYGQTLELDVCLSCHLFWFDQGENLQLTPDATMALFQLIHEHGSASEAKTHKIDAVLSCVHCPRTLKFTQDRTLKNRFNYRACPQGHGRLMSFYNFLSEKQFIRELTPAERGALSISVRQINCSSCAAPVDIAKEDACGYCRAPVAVFDREAAMKAVQMYLQRRHLPQSAAALPVPDSSHVSSYGHTSPALDALYALQTGSIAADILSAVAYAGTHQAASWGVQVVSNQSSGVFDLVADGVTGLLSSLFD